MNVTIIGTGKMARGLSARLLEGGNNVTLVGHSPGKANALADELKREGGKGSISAANPDSLPGEIVILAVPYSAVSCIVRQFVELLPGKILVDITNPIDYQIMESIIPAGSSAAEEIARMVPISVHVIKAFNTTFASTLQTGEVSGLRLDVFMAGDDEHAKAKVAQLAEGGRLRVFDVGPLTRARQLEAMGLLNVVLQAPYKLGYKNAIKIIN